MRSYTFKFKHRNGRYVRVKSEWFDLVRENGVQYYDEINFEIYDNDLGEEYTMNIRRRGASPPPPEA